MKRLQGLFAAKMIAILVLTTCIITIPFLGYQTLYSLSQCEEVYKFSDLFQYSYSESEEFSRDVNVRLMQLADYLKLKEILETNGKLDYNKVAAKVYGSNGIEEYTVSDLIKYNVENYGFYPEEAILDSLFDTEDARIVFDSTRRLTYPIVVSKGGNAVVGGEPKQVPLVADFTKEENLVFSDLDEACRYYQEVWDQQIKDGNYIEGAEVNLLPDAAYFMTFYVAFYQQYQSIFEREVFSEQDLLYWIADGNQVMATNMQNHLPEKDDSNRMKYPYPVMGEICYQTENHLMEATMRADRGMIAELEELFLEKNRKNISIYIAVPRDQSGFFSQQMERLERQYHSIPQYIGVMIVLGVLAAFSIYALFCFAGHKAGYEGIYLNWFDRWYTEIAAGICMTAGLLLAILVFEFLGNFYYNLDIEDLVLFVLSAAALYLVSLISFSSLAKRIKAGTLWKNSITHRTLNYMKNKTERAVYTAMQIWESRSISKKIAIFFICMLLGNFVFPIALYFFCSALDYGELVIALPCFCILFAILAMDFKVLRWLIRQKAELVEIYQGTERISSREWNYKLEENSFHGILQQMAGAVNRVGDGLNSAIEQSVRDERMKTDLITNVSHDIKTPLTSIINYIDLLKREQFEDEKVCSYLEILDQKSQRLKNLIDDLIEASKLSSETVVLSMEKIDLVELVKQTNGEFAEKFAEKNLTIVSSLPEKSIFIEADGRRLWRVLENLYINVSKYAMEHTRVYISVLEKAASVEFTIKNISDSPLNIDASELTERFIRGDVSRSTEGSGLGLSIAKSLTELMHGKFEIYLDGDLFRVTLLFGIVEKEEGSVLIQQTAGM